MYEIIFDASAANFFKKLDKNLQERIGKKIGLLKDNPKLGKPLTGNLAGLWSLRVDKYRALYRILNDKLIIFILDIGHRKNIYEK